MRNPLDLKPEIDTILDDVRLAIQAEIADLNYNDYLDRTNGIDQDPEEFSPEQTDILERIATLSNLENWLKWYGQNLQRWHR